MMRINLLPQDMVKKREKSPGMAFFLFPVLLLSLAFFWEMHLDGQVREKQERLTVNGQKAASLETGAKEFDILRNEMTLLETKLEIMRGLEKGRRETVDILVALTETIIPGRMWLSEYKAEKEGIRITGFALDDKTIADFMTNLENKRTFSMVTLENVQQATHGQIFLRSFSISCLGKELQVL